MDRGKFVFMAGMALLLLLCFSACGDLDFNFKKLAFKDKQNKEQSKDYSKDDALMAENNHMKFKGVPIDGTLKLFVERMKRKGFEEVRQGSFLGSSESLSGVLRGDFADYTDCLVYVETLDQKDLVARIIVAFPFQDKWEYLYGDYKRLKDMLSQKYGKPYQCVEKFQNNYGLPMDDNDRMHAVGMDRCKYESRFRSDKGDILLRIEHDSFECFVALAYKDRINCEAVEKHALNDL